MKCSWTGGWEARHPHLSTNILRRLWERDRSTGRIGHPSHLTRARLSIELPLLAFGFHQFFSGVRCLFVLPSRPRKGWKSNDRLGMLIQPIPTSLACHSAEPAHKSIHIHRNNPQWKVELKTGLQFSDQVEADVSKMCPVLDCLLPREHRPCPTSPPLLPLPGRCWPLLSYSCPMPVLCLLSFTYLLSC